MKRSYLKKSYLIKWKFNSFIQLTKVLVCLQVNIEGCRDACLESAQCAASLTCHEGICSGHCLNDSECGDNFICSNSEYCGALMIK